MFSVDWTQALRIITMAFLSLIALICIIRMTGSRTLSKMNSLDFIITIALGSTVSTAILDKQVTAFEALIAEFLSNVVF